MGTFTFCGFQTSHASYRVYIVWRSYQELNDIAAKPVTTVWDSITTFLSVKPVDICTSGDFWTVSICVFLATKLFAKTVKTRSFPNIVPTFTTQHWKRYLKYCQISTIRSRTFILAFVLQNLPCSALMVFAAPLSYHFMWCHDVTWWCRAVQQAPFPPLTYQTLLSSQHAF